MEEKVYLETSDGLKLCGILTHPEIKASTCIILCHGITVEKNEGGIFTHLADKLAKNGFNVFRFDFRGHGESEGSSIDMTISNETRDIETAVKFLKNRGFKTFGIVAASFAGGAASFYVSKNQNLIKALCLWNPLIDYDSIINAETQWGRKYWGKPALDRVEKFGFTEIGSKKIKIGKNLIYEVWKFKPWKELLKVSLLILFVHGDKDTYVPYQDSVKYSRLVKNGTLVTIKGAEHGFHDKAKDSEQADRATLKFFLRHL